MVKRQASLNTAVPDAAITAMVTSGAITRDGGIVLGIRPPSGPAYAFSPDGTFRGRIRAGSAVGLVPRAQVVLSGPGDSLHFIDLDEQRRSVLSPELRAIRTVPFRAMSTSAILLRDNRLLVAGTVPTAAQIGHRFHLFGPDGRWHRSFGADDRPVSLLNGPGARSILAPARDGGFWAAAEDRHRLERWTADGRRVQVMARQSPVFAGDSGGPRMSGAIGHRPSPVLAAVREAPDGLVWLLFNVPSADWRRGLGKPVPRGRGGVAYPDRDFDKLFDTVIEVVDPRSGGVLQSTRVPFFAQVLLADGLLVAERRRSDGGRAVDLWRVRLVEKPQTTE